MKKKVEKNNVIGKGKKNRTKLFISEKHVQKPLHECMPSSASRGVACVTAAEGSLHEFCTDGRPCAHVPGIAQTAHSANYRLKAVTENQ
jgi:hypothetical protein